MNVTIPEAVHICRGCDALCNGATYCARCREEIESSMNFHIARAAQLYSALPRTTGVMPESGKLSQAQWQVVRMWTRIGFGVAVLGFWLWVAVDIFSRSR